MVFKKLSRNHICVISKIAAILNWHSATKNRPPIRDPSNSHNNQIALDKSISLRWHCAFAWLFFKIPVQSPDQFPNRINNCLYFKLFLIRLKFAFGWLTELFLIVWNSAWVASDRWFGCIKDRELCLVLHKTHRGWSTAILLHTINYSISLLFQFFVRALTFCARHGYARSLFFFIIIASIHSLGILCVCVLFCPNTRAETKPPAVPN